MPNKPTTLREEFDETVGSRIYAVYFHEDKSFSFMSITMDKEELFNWFQSKFTSYSTELLSKIEGMRDSREKEPNDIHESGRLVGFNQALDQVISFINQEKL